MYILVHYTDTQSNHSLIVQDSDFSKNLSFSTVCPVQMIGGKVMKKAMFAVPIIYDWGKKGNIQRQIYICLQMIALRVDLLQRCTNCITHTETNFRNSKVTASFSEFLKTSSSN